LRNQETIVTKNHINTYLRFN